MNYKLTIRITARTQHETGFSAISFPVAMEIAKMKTEEVRGFAFNLTDESGKTTQFSIKRNRVIAEW